MAVGFNRYRHGPFDFSRLQNLPIFIGKLVHFLASLITFNLTEDILETFCTKIYSIYFTCPCSFLRKSLSTNKNDLNYYDNANR